MEEKKKSIRDLRNLKQKTKLIIILSAEFLAIAIILLLIFFAGKKTHVVTFDLNGGILISGEIEQRVTQGQNATPPTVAKYGHYLLRWSGSYKSVTQDVTVKAIWEYETSPGVEYSVPENTNYCEIYGCFPEIQGELFIGSYYNNRPVLGIQEGAFRNMTGLTAIHLLDGILTIKAEAFAGCTALEVLDMPGTIVRIGEGAFKDCSSLKSITLPDTLRVIEAGAFVGCDSLTEIIIPSSVEVIEEGAFAGCKGLKKVSVSGNGATISAGAFAGCTALTELKILGGVEAIGEGAFAGCTALESLALYRDPIYVESTEETPSDNESDGNGKSDKQDGKGNDEADEEKVEIPPRPIIKIGAFAFAGCESLSEIIIPENIVEIGSGAFDTPNMTIKLCISQSELPDGFADSWCAEDATLVFDYIPESVEDESTEDDTDEDDKSSSLWGGLS